jgi:hypothetical protein
MNIAISRVKRVSDGTRARGRRDHNPRKVVLMGVDAAYHP